MSMQREASPEDQAGRSSEQLLISQIIQGNHAQLNKLLEQVEKPLYAFVECNLRGAARQRLDASDVYNETICRALKNLNRFDENKGNFRQWLFGIAQFTLLEMARRAEKGQGEAARGESLFHPVAQSAWERTTRVSTLLSRDDSFRILREAIQSLPEEEQLLCDLMGFQGLTAAQTASQMGIGSEAVTKRWQRLRKKLGSMPLVQVVFQDFS